jgi:hypothetical protein
LPLPGVERSLFHPPDLSEALSQLDGLLHGFKVEVEHVNQVEVFNKDCTNEPAITSTGVESTIVDLLDSSQLLL